MVGAARPENANKGALSHVHPLARLAVAAAVLMAVASPAHALPGGPAGATSEASTRALSARETAPRAGTPARTAEGARRPPAAARQSRVQGLANRSVRVSNARLASPRAAPHSSESRGFGARDASTTKRGGATPPGVDVVVFDVDGTLARSRPQIVFAVQKTVAAFAPREAISPERLEALCDGRSVRQVYDALYPNAGAAERARWLETYVRNEREGTKAIGRYPGTAKMLRDLKARYPGVRVAIATGKDEAGAELALRQIGLDPHDFDAIVGTRGTALPPKPSGAVLREIGSRLGVPTARMVMIGDTPADVLAGRDAGVAATVAMTHGYGKPSELANARPTRSLARFDQLVPALTRGVAPRAEN